jgi:Protein of unknown function (DUF3617)
MTWKMQRFEQRDINTFLERTDLPSAMSEVVLSNYGIPISSRTSRKFLLCESRTAMTWRGTQRVAIATVFLILAAVMSAGAALVADLPHRKPGLWEVKYLHGATTQYCIDAAVDKLTLGIAGPLDPDECQKIDMQRSGDVVTIDFTCTMKGKPATAHTVVSGSFDTAYTMTRTVQGEDVLPSERAVTIAGTWLGPCAADQRPGDIVKPAFPNGGRLNILDMIKAKSRPL